MGFEKPDGQEFHIPVSDTQAYRQFGNSVVVPVVEAVTLHMEPWIAGSILGANQQPPKSVLSGPICKLFASVATPIAPSDEAAALVYLL